MYSFTEGLYSNAYFASVGTFSHIIWNILLSYKKAKMKILSRSIWRTWYGREINHPRSRAQTNGETLGPQFCHLTDHSYIYCTLKLNTYTYLFAFLCAVCLSTGLCAPRKSHTVCLVPLCNSGASNTQHSGSMQQVSAHSRRTAKLTHEQTFAICTTSSFSVKASRRAGSVKPDGRVYVGRGTQWKKETVFSTAILHTSGSLYPAKQESKWKRCDYRKTTFLQWYNESDCHRRTLEREALEREVLSIAMSSDLPQTPKGSWWNGKGETLTASGKTLIQPQNSITPKCLLAKLFKVSQN